jgi:4-hydroxyphenylpyruvate dioxygenase
VRRSIATVSVSGTLLEKIEAIAAARFDGVEIFENDLIFSNAAPRDVRRYASDVGLTIDLYQPFRDFDGVSDAQFKRNLVRAERKFDLMEDLGAPLILVCSNVSPDTIDDEELMAGQLYELAQRAGKRGLRIGYEALSWGAKVRTFDKAWRIVERANHPHLGLIVDSFHTLALPDDWSGLDRLPGERIFFVQLADAPRLGVSTLTLSRHYRNLPGEGDFEVPEFLRKVLAAGYTGTISLEIFNDDLRAAPPRQTANDAMRSLLFLEEQVRLAEEAQPAGERKKRRRVELFDPPAVPVFSEVAFIEFAVDAATEPRLAALFTQLGFRRLGRHRSKAVTLYAQGGIRLILNHEPDSFAHSYQLLHGTSVCALALRTDDPQAALGRAESFGSMRFEGRVAPSEMVLAGVRSPAGSLIYFTQDWGLHRVGLEADFILEDVEDGEAALARVDHIAQALPEGQLDAWVLFYRAVLGLEPEPTFILADPQGLTRSKAVANPERTVRFPLNISDDRNTATARSVSSFGGAGVHHIAFLTDDIFAAAQRLERAGTPLLRIPANYYDDVAARFQLDEDAVARLQEHNILYDEDAGGGAFYQLYTLPFEERFFFEIVQRAGGYDQYGAANAPVRMAALAQQRAERPSQILR